MRAQCEHDLDIYCENDMTGFCTTTIRPEANLRPANGILRSEALSVTDDARTAAARILAQARSEAEAILDAARSEAEQIRAQAREQAQQAVVHAEKESFERSTQWLQALEQTQVEFLQRAEATVLDLAQGLFERLVLETPPRERIEAGLRRLLQEAPRRLANPVLHVHPEDAVLLPPTEWEVKHDASLGRGACRLEAAAGEWTFGFDAAAQALRDAFGESIHEGE
jgi:flagellar biosynthesis/type III secretory pathway protein FliH